MSAGQHGTTSNVNRVALVLGPLVCLAGCINTFWTIPEPFLRPGSSVVYLKTRKETESVTSSVKGSSVHTVVDKTRYRAIDLRTCAKMGDFTFPGATHELAWDAEAEDLWIALDSAPDNARSMKGRTVALPPGISLHAPKNDDLPATRIFRASAGGTAWLWRVHAGSVEIIAPDGPRIAAVVSAGPRTVAVSRLDSDEELELLIVDEVPGGPSAVNRRRLPVKGPAAYSGSLLRGGAAIAFLTPDALEIFDLASGQRTDRYPRPAGTNKTSWPSASPPALAFAAYDRDINQAGCSARVSMIDLERASKTERASTFAACFASLSWIGGSQILVAETQTTTREQRCWLLDVASNWWVSVPEQAQAWQGFGKTVVFADGPIGARHLTTAGPPSTAVEPVTSDLGDVRVLMSEPISRTVVVTAAPDELFLYRVDSRHLDHCPNL